MFFPPTDTEADAGGLCAHEGVAVAAIAIAAAISLLSM
jgi:hypothetical protein